MKRRRQLANLLGNQGLIVRPGDTLIVRYERMMRLDQASEIKAALAKRLPGVEVLVIECDEIAVYRPFTESPQTETK